MSRSAIVAFALAALAAAGAVAQPAGEKKPPKELLTLVPAGTRYLDHAAADLNGDGRADYVLVVENEKRNAEGDVDESDRRLLVLVRQPGGALVAKSGSTKAVFCSGCGGMLGDPFSSVQARSGSFTIHHHGGSAWRWATEFQFAYSKRDDAWQLVRVKETSYHASVGKEEVKTFRPPKDFGKIDLGDFDPEKFKGVGKL